MEAELSCVPPGFRFHPTEEELVGYYLTRKVNSQSIDLGVITDIDLYRIEPWDLHARCNLGFEEQTDQWYFFSHKDKKYPTGTRTNRATAAGFWKATGRDKVVLSKDRIIGMRKTLVFYRGRAPNGRKTEWVIHEYRLQTSEYGRPPQEEGWVVCKAFRKQSPYSQRSCYRYCSSPAYLQVKSNFAYQAPIEDALCYPNEAFNFDDHGRATDHEQYKEPSKTKKGCPQLCSLPLPTSSNSRDSLLQDRNIAATDEERLHLEPGFIIDWKMLDGLLATQLCESDIGPPADFSLST